MSGVDLVEGTVVLDVKPYHPGDTLEIDQLEVCTGKHVPGVEL